MKKNYGEDLGWEIDVDFPSWGNTEIYVKTISKGYLLLVKNQRMLLESCNKSCPKIK